MQAVRVAWDFHQRGLYFTWHIPTICKESFLDVRSYFRWIGASVACIAVGNNIFITNRSAGLGWQSNTSWSFDVTRQRLDRVRIIEAKLRLLTRPNIPGTRWASLQHAKLSGAFDADRSVRKFPERKSERASKKKNRKKSAITTTLKRSQQADINLLVASEIYGQVYYVNASLGYYILLHAACKSAVRALPPRETILCAAIFIASGRRHS